MVAGNAGSLKWRQEGAMWRLTLPEKFVGKYAYGVKMVGVSSLENGNEKMGR